MRVRRWAGVLGAALILGSLGCRGLIAPAALEEGGFQALTLSGQVLDPAGRPVTGELLFDNRQYTEDPTRWLVYRIILDAQGKFTFHWREKAMADFEVIPPESLGAPTYRVLSVPSDGWTGQLEYPMEYSSWRIDFPAAVSVNTGTLHMRRTRSRSDDAPPYKDHFTLEMDSTRTMSGWAGSGLWELEARFYGPDSESLGIDFHALARPDSQSFAEAIGRLQTRQLTMEWSDGIPADTALELRSATYSYSRVTNGLEWRREYSRASWPSQVLVPTEDATVSVRTLSGPLILASGSSVRTYPNSTAPVELSTGAYSVQVRLGVGWPDGVTLEARLKQYYWIGSSHVSSSQSALFLVDAGNYLLEVEDSYDLLVRREVLDVNQNIDITIDAPDTAAQP